MSADTFDRLVKGVRLLYPEQIHMLVLATVLLCLAYIFHCQKSLIFSICTQVLYNHQPMFHIYTRNFVEYFTSTMNIRRTLAYSILLSVQEDKIHKPSNTILENRHRILNDV